MVLDGLASHDFFCKVTNMKKMDKKKAQVMHTQKRCLERLGFYPEKQTIETWVAKIQNGSAKFLDRQSHRITRWVIAHKEDEFIVVYDKNRKNITTILPMEFVEHAKTKLNDKNNVWPSTILGKKDCKCAVN